MRVLVICDDFWHPAGVVRQGLAPLATSGHSFTWLENARDWSADQLAGFPVAILAKSNNVSAADQTPWITPDVESSLRDYVRSGHGLLVIHSGTVGGQRCLTLRALLGGAFVSHPKQCPVTVIPRQGHALTVGVSAFTETDEHYQMQLDETQASVFLTSESGSAPTQPAGWTRSEGAGRVCVLTPGHTAAVWLQPSFQRLLANALSWCTHSD